MSNADNTLAADMADIEATLATNWWAIVLRGVVAVLFGIVALALPTMGLLALVVLFGTYALLEGILNVVAAVRGARSEARWGVLLFEGLVSIAAAIITFLWPGLTALALVFIVAVWAFVTGIFEIAAAVRLRKYVRGEWLLALSGVLSVAFGILLAIFPGTGAIAMVFWIGAYAILFGALLIGLGLRVRTSHPRPGSHPTMQPPLHA